ATVREHLSAAVVDERIYVIGGRWDDQGNLATNEVYDPASDRWEVRSPMPTRRGGLTAAVVDGQIHVLGGEAFDPNRTFPEHEVYDPLIDGWTTAQPLPTPRHGLGSAALEHDLYIIGGGTSARLSPSTTVQILTRPRRAAGCQWPARKGAQQQGVVMPSGVGTPGGVPGAPAVEAVLPGDGMITHGPAGVC